MDKEKSDYLWEQFPFAQSSGNPRHDLMCFGFECSEGWYPILYRLFEKLKAMDLDESFRIVQVKEKFGGLRVYTNWGSDEIFALIDAAEQESFKTCEYCGKPGEVRNMSWIKTLCDDCYENWEKKRFERWKKANRVVEERSKQCRT